MCDVCSDGVQERGVGGQWRNVVVWLVIHAMKRLTNKVLLCMVPLVKWRSDVNITAMANLCV